MTHKLRFLAPLDRIALRPLGAGFGQIVLLPPGEIAYAFLGSAAPPELLALCIENCWRFEPRRVYVRTSRGIYWTHYRRLAELKRGLEPVKSGLFFPIGRARLVNALKISLLDAGGRTPLLVFMAADGRKEMLNVTRRAWPALRDRLRVPRRWGGAKKPAGAAVRPARDTQKPVRSRSDWGGGKSSAG